MSSKRHPAAASAHLLHGQVNKSSPGFKLAYSLTASVQQRNVNPQAEFKRAKHVMTK